MKSKFTLLFACAFGFSSFCRSQTVTYLSSGSGTAETLSGNFLSITKTTPLWSNFVIVTVSEYQKSYPVTVTDATTLTSFILAKSVVTNGGSLVAIYYLIGPGVGSHTMNISTGLGNNANIKATISYYSGVNTLAPIASTASKTNSDMDNNPRLTITSAVGQMVVDAMTYERPVSANTGDPAQVTIGYINSHGWNFGSSYRSGVVPSISMSWDYSQDVGAYWGIAAVSLSPAAPSTLPLVLSDFSAVKKEDNKVLIKWTSEDDRPNTTEVMRSFDGRNFTSVQSFDYTNVNTSQSVSYLDDASARSGDHVYYQLKTTETSGAKYYSKIINISYTGFTKNGFALYPNPASSYTVVSITSDREATRPAQVQLIDMAGRIVQQKNLQVEKGTTQVMLTGLNDLSKGMYIVRVAMEDVVQVQKLIKN